MQMAVMLSVPINSRSPFFISLAIISSKSSETGLDRTLMLSFSLDFKILSILVVSLFVHYSLVTQSQIPSHASIMNLSSFDLLVLVQSGKHVTACSARLSFPPLPVRLTLYSKSPMPLLTARLPLILFSIT